LAVLKSPLAPGRALSVNVGPCGRGRPDRSGTEQPELPLAALKLRPRVLEPEVAARVAISCRAKPSSLPGYVRLVLTLELRRELAEKLSLKAIKSERNIEAIVIALIEEAAKRWR